MAKIRPEGFEPPYPASSPALPETLNCVQALVAIQSPAGQWDDALCGALMTKFAADDNPRHAERVGHVRGLSRRHRPDALLRDQRLRR